MTPAIDQFLRARQGPMTSELVQRPGAFGLGNVPARLAPTTTSKSICGFCSTGCGLLVHRDADGQAINVTPDPSYPVNLGMACPKGWEAITPLLASDRATSPLLRDPLTSELTAVDWTRALHEFTTRFKAIQQKHGNHSIAVLSTGQIFTEEMALLGAVAKLGMGLRHVDSNTRQCMATSHVAYKQSFGFDAPPYTYGDFEESDLMFFIGANPAIAHPIQWQRVQRNRHKPTIVVVDPRRTETAMCATHHVQPNPRTDIWFLYGVAHEIIARGWERREFLNQSTNGFAEFAEFLRDYSPERCAEQCGIPADEIRRYAKMIHEARAASLWWTMGVNQGHESTRTAQAIINLCLLTGHIGRPGTGPNSITGQCNAMGSRLFANATSLFGGRDTTNAVHRQEVAQILGVPEAVIPKENSWAYDQIIDGIDRGDIKGLWVIATNPAHSWVNQAGFAKTREKLEFLVVQDMYPTTETARMADLILPAAGWGEKTGTFINSERRLGFSRKVSRAPGEALADFTILKLVAEAWGCGHLFESWSSPQAAFGLLQKLSAGRPCDFTGIRDFQHIEDCGGIQWPFRAADAERLRQAETQRASEFAHAVAAANAAVVRTTPENAGKAASTTANASGHGNGNTNGSGNGNGAANDASKAPLPRPTALPLQARLPHLAATNERRLFADGRFFTPDGKAKFLFDAPRPLPEVPDAEFPFHLNTGRGSSAQWHTGSRTDKSEILRKLAPRDPYVEIHPDDAQRLGIVDHADVFVRSRRGVASAVAVVTPTVRPGQLFMAMHFAQVNNLTFPAYDPHSRQPSYKHCAVQIEVVKL